MKDCATQCFTQYRHAAVQAVALEASAEPAQIIFPYQNYTDKIGKIIMGKPRKISSAGYTPRARHTQWRLSDVIECKADEPIKKEIGTHTNLSLADCDFKTHNHFNSKGEIVI